MSRPYPLPRGVIEAERERDIAEARAEYEFANDGLRLYLGGCDALGQIANTDVIRQHMDRIEAAKAAYFAVLGVA